MSESPRPAPCSLLPAPCSAPPHFKLLISRMPSTILHMGLPPCLPRRNHVKAGRAAASTKAELCVRPRDNKTTRQHGRSPVVSGQLSGSPISIDPPNNRSAPGRICRGEQRITDPPKDGFASPSCSALRAGSVANNSSAEADS